MHVIHIISKLGDYVIHTGNESYVNHASQGYTKFTNPGSYQVKQI